MWENKPSSLLHKKQLLTSTPFPNRKLSKTATTCCVLIPVELLGLAAYRLYV